MCRLSFREILCLFLVVPQLGCQSVYRFRCTCNPPLAGVVVREQVMGETPCDVTIPRDSELIRDGKVEFTFFLPEGPQRTKVVEIRHLKSSNPLAEAVAAPFVFVGSGLLVWATATSKEDDGESPPAHAADGDEGGRHGFLTLLAGLGITGIGAGLHALLGGHSDSLTPYEVQMDFSAPPDARESQIPVPRRSSREEDPAG